MIQDFPIRVSHLNPPEYPASTCFVGSGGGSRWVVPGYGRNTGNEGLAARWGKPVRCGVHNKYLHPSLSKYL